MLYYLKKAAKPFKYSPPHIYYLNLKNRWRYGAMAPRFAEIIWVKPRECSKALASDTLKKVFGFSEHEIFGRVVESCWPLEEVRLITNLSLIKYCIEHWVHGVPWEDTGEYDRMEKRIRESPFGHSQGCRNRDDIIRRCENLDRIFEQAKQEGRLRTKEEISPENDWDLREMVIHIGPEGELYKGGSGMHRFAIAYILDIPFPAQIGLVHVSAIPYLDDFRKRSRVDL